VFVDISTVMSDLSEICDCEQGRIDQLLDQGLATMLHRVVVSKIVIL